MIKIKGLMATGQNKWPIAALALALSGCGGGSESTEPGVGAKSDVSAETSTSAGVGSDSDSDQSTVTAESNQAPEVSIAEMLEQQERIAFSLTASASDEDGHVASYAWSHSSSLSLTQTGTDTATPTYTVPDIQEDTNITFTVTVTDDKGVTQQSSQSVLIKRNTASVTLNGRVTDEPIANANVVLAAGSTEVQVKANEAGHYSATLLVDESEAHYPVRISATGEGAQSQVEFVSVLNSMAQLVQQAGEDGLLDKAENFGVNVTNVSTAEYALMTRTGAPLTSELELNQALLNVDADEKMLLASLIKIVVDHSDYSLPEGVTSTLDLVNDEHTAQQFESQINAADPALLEQTKAAIKQDSDLIDDTTSPLGGEFILQAVKYFNAGAYHLTLSDAGKGTLSAINTVEIESWQQDNNKVQITLAEPLHISTWDGNTDRSVYIDSLAMTILAENAVFKTVDIVEQGTTVFRGDSPSTAPYEKAYTSNLLDKGMTLALPDNEEMLGLWHIEVRESDGKTARGFPDQYQLEQNGEISTPLQDPKREVQAWRVNGNTLEVDYQAGEQTVTEVFWITKKLGAAYQYVSLARGEAGMADTRYGILVKQQPEAAFTDRNVVGRWQGFIGTSQTFHMDLFSSGELYVDTYDWQYAWRVDKGELIRERFSYDGTITPECKPGMPECVLDAKVTHQLVAQSDEHYIVSRQFERFDNKGNTTSFYHNLLVYHYTPEITQTEFLPSNLDEAHYMWAQNETSGWYEVIFGPIYWDSISRKDQLVIDGVVYQYALEDGKLAVMLDEQLHYVELLDYDASGMQICFYAASQGCQESDKQQWYYDFDGYAISTQAIGQGKIYPRYQKVPEGDTASVYIEPEAGYMLQSITGCDGELYDLYYHIPARNTDCEITATFVEKPDLAELAGITDLRLAECVNQTSVQSPQAITSLACTPSDPIQSLNGLNNLTGLQDLTLGTVAVSEFDLSGLSQLTSLSIERSERGITRLNVAHPEQLLALKLRHAGLSDDRLASLDLARFTALQQLDLSRNALSRFNGDSWPNLVKLVLSDNRLDTLSLDNNPQLHELDVSINSLSVLNIADKPQLHYLDVSSNSLSVLNIADKPQLHYLDVSWNSLTVLDIANNLQLRHLYASGNALKQLDITDHASLYSVSLSGNQLTQVLTGEHPWLTQFGARENKLTAMQLDGMPQLNELYLEVNELAQLDTSYNPELERLYIDATQLDQLDLSANPLLKSLSVDNTPLLSELDLRQNLQLTNLSVSDNTRLQSVMLADGVQLTSLDIAYSPLLMSQLGQFDSERLSSLHISGVDSRWVDLGRYPQLTSLNWQNASLEQVDLSSLTKLKRLQLGRNPLTQIDLSHNTLLEDLFFSYTSITELDLQHNPLLHSVYVQANALHSVTGVEAIENTGVRLKLDTNPLSDDTASYLLRLQNEGYGNLTYSQSSWAKITVTGSGSVNERFVELENQQSFELILQPGAGHQVGSATGCPGELQGTIYRLGPLQGYCMLQVEFVPLP
ncbi:PKD domain-containing protein [Pseudoalteromonas viridis]|uniref:Uncharacterized protein n=1 Tax=Pseudoalteromonas viridis TaxID=339617 RepID=A0ABX7VA51_9GAMM|nr:MucBP domain-containing leucine-rich repeat protein [Pseudoalteromonas viridis]QTL36632.1 hypothetical protein J5X90_06260 [Pseudoalteromonas viridis]